MEHGKVRKIALSLVRKCTTTVLLLLASHWTTHDVWHAYWLPSHVPDMQQCDDALCQVELLSTAYHVREHASQPMGG